MGGRAKEQRPRLADCLHKQILLKINQLTFRPGGAHVTKASPSLISKSAITDLFKVKQKKVNHSTL